ncbi:sugar kinase [Streptomyces sp. A7024]|uniref:Sugar kinase n=1 Tax=Streptomyces coryli TaxID=1128680 RepID=A0A6G4U9Z3_9ACTN|nr:sugar kinase [Streptomyces coryli]
MLLVVGDVITDVVARHDKPLARGTDTAARIALLPGGAGANCAAWAAHCGARVRLLTRAGADAADWHRDELLRAGVEPHVVVDPGAPTGTVIALVDGADAERSFLTDSGASFRAGPQDWSPRLLRDVTRLHLSGYLYFTPNGRALAATAAAAAHERGVPVSVDPASVGFIEELGVRAFAAAIRDADVLLPNASEAALLTGLDDPAKAAAALAARHGAAVVTLGAAGAVAAGPGGAAPVRVRAPRATPLDSTGAGDAFNGAYLAAACAGATPEAAAEAGCRAGSLAVTVIGGRPPGESVVTRS